MYTLETSLIAQLVKNLPAMQKTQFQFLGEGDGNPLQYSCLENPMDRGAWQAMVQGVARVRHDLAIKPPPRCILQISNNFICQLYLSEAGKTKR